MRRYIKSVSQMALLVLLGCSSSREPSPASLSPITAEAAYATTTPDHFGAVASVNPVATQAGLNAFAAGGNAVDAAIAVAFTLGVVDGHNSGIGGGCLILVKTADGRMLAIDGREMAPAAASPDMYVRDGKAVPELSKTGALAAGVPGSVAALYQLQVLAGKLKFAEVLLPAAKIAERGFPLDAAVATRLQSSRENIVKFPSTAAIFLKADGQTLAAGEILKQKDLADSYRKLAKHGPAWFYHGEFARKTAGWMAANGGLLTAQDFVGYHTEIRTPIQSQFHDYTIYGFPPPSSGGVLIAQMLNIAQEFDLPSLSDADRTHVLAEIMRLSFADRAKWLGDPDFVAVPKGLLSPEYGKSLAAKIRMEVAADTVSPGLPPDADTQIFDKHTTHIATVDKDGNWVAITTTLNTSFGSKVVIPGTGVLLNNQMDDFVVQPNTPNAYGLVGEAINNTLPANSIAPRKRPLSSMSPTLVEKDGQLVLTLGAAGGPTIVNQVFQVLVRRLALGQSIAESVAGFRIHHQWQPNKLFVEDRVPQAVQQALIARGHTLQNFGSFGGTQAIGIEDGNFKAVTEPRIIERKASGK